MTFIFRNRKATLTRDESTREIEAWLSAARLNPPESVSMTVWVAAADYGGFRHSFEKYRSALPEYAQMHFKPQKSEFSVRIFRHKLTVKKLTKN